MYLIFEPLYEISVTLAFTGIMLELNYFVVGMICADAILFRVCSISIFLFFWCKFASITAFDKFKLLSLRKA